MRIAITKTALIIGLIAICTVTYPQVNADSNPSREGTWVLKAPAIPSRELMIASTNEKIYAIGGMDSEACVNYNQEYDPASDTWAVKKPIPTARADAAIAVYKDSIYVIGGITGLGAKARYSHSEPLLAGITGVNEVYDFLTDSWESKSPLPINMSHIRAGIVEDKLFLIGGNVNLMYDLTNDSWVSRTPPPIPVWKYALAVVKSSLYLFGGASSPDGYSWKNITQVYDTKTDSWSRRQATPEVFIDPVAVKTSGNIAPERVYVISFANRTHVYDSANDSWVVGAQMSTQRAVFGAGVANDLLYVIGGGSGTFPTLYPAYGYNEQYTPISYGIPQATYQSPSPSLTATLSPSPSPSPTPSALTLSPSPSIPELPTSLILPLLLIVALLTVFATKRSPNTAK